MEKGTLGSEETILRLLEALGYEVKFTIVDKYASECSEKERILGILRALREVRAQSTG